MKIIFPAITLLVIASMPVSAGSLVGGPAVSGCTPATINQAAISRIRPHTSIEAVEATLGCMPAEWLYSPETNATTYSFMVPLLNVSIWVVVDTTGVAFAEYFNFVNPLEASYSGALRAEPPLAPSMMPSAGVFPTIP